MNRITTKIRKALCIFDYGTKCHGYNPDGSHAHHYRCKDDDCPRQIQPGEYYDSETGRWCFK